MNKELTNKEIVKKINNGESLKKIAEEIGYTESAIRKRINKEYFYSKGIKKYIRKDKKKDIEKLESLSRQCNAMDEIGILIMERYKNEEYWEENEYEIWDELYVDEKIVIPEFLYDELMEDCKKLSVDIDEVIQLYLLRYVTYFKKRNGSGLNFERNYDKAFDKRENHDSQVLLKDNEYEIRQLDREIKRLSNEGNDNEEIEFITRYGADEEEETDILYKAYLRKKGFNNGQIIQIKKNDLYTYYRYVKNGEITEFEKIKEELKRQELEYKAEVEKEEKEYQEKKLEEKNQNIAVLKENGYTDKQIQRLSDYEIKQHYKKCKEGKTFNEIVKMLKSEEIERNILDKYISSETKEEKKERHIAVLKENGYTDEQIKGLNENQILEHCLYLYTHNGESFELVKEGLKIKKNKEYERIKELENAAEKIISREENDKSWIEDAKNEIRLKIEKEISEGKERKIYTGSIPIQLMSRGNK